MRSELTLDDWYGLEIKGTLITGDWEGDRDVVGGVHYLPDYIEDVAIYYDGDDITDLFTPKAVREAGDALLEAHFV